MHEPEKLDRECLLNDLTLPVTNINDAMEKFAIDLDKVLDDFEFNEDCAEQIASVNPSTNNASSSSVKCTLEPSTLKSYNYLLIEPKKANKEFDVILPVDRTKDSQQISTRNKCVSEHDAIPDNFNHSAENTTIQTTDVNQFYPEDSTNDNKLIHKQSISSYESEQVPLTVYNDISQKYMQKQQNGNNSPKIDNRYDKKLNQFNLKPSVSNVFSSLNEYINTPPGSSDCIRSMLDEQEIQSNLEPKSIYHGNEVPQLIQSTSKDSDKIIVLKQIIDVADSTREASGPIHVAVPVPLPLALPVPYESNIKEDVAKNVTNLESLEGEERPKSIEVQEVCTGLDNKTEIKNENVIDYNCDAAKENDSRFECGSIQDFSSENKVKENEEQTRKENTDAFKEHENSSNPKQIGFSNISDISEDELTKYLTELEEEEKLKESCNKQENIVNKSQNDSHNEKDENKQSFHIFSSTVIEPSNMLESELNEREESVSIVECKNEEKNEETLNDASEQQNVQRDDQVKEDKHILNTLSSKELKLAHAVNADRQEKIKLEGECVANVKSVKDSQEHSMYSSLNINQGSLNNGKTELKEEEGSTDQASELKKACDIDNEEKNAITSDLKVFGDKTKRNDDVMSTSVNISARPNACDTGDELEKPVRPQTLDIVLTNNSNENQPLGSTSDTPSSQVQPDADATKEEQGSSPDILENSISESGSVLGKQPPFWVPDSYAPSCMLCDVKFTVLKRRHHCRACGKVLCNKCCNMKYKLQYQGNIDSRVCVPCYQLLTKAETEQNVGEWSSGYSTCIHNNDINSPQGRQPNPNNPMEYCSTIPPLQQLAGGLPPPPTVMVPVGVLKREGGTKNRPEISKSVMFSDELDMSWDLRPPYRKSGSKRIPTPGSSVPSTSIKKQNLPRMDPSTDSYVPQDPNALPPTVTIHKGQVSYHAVTDEDLLYKMLKNECEPPVMFAINRNLYAYVKIVTLNCCVNKTCWNVTSKGLDCVGQDEIILLIEVLPEETRVPKDLLLFINQLFLEATKGNTVTELGFSIYQGGNFMDSREHAGFLFIRQTLQCLQKIILPPAPYLFGLLVHRWETPWAKVFPLRLVLRLGAEYRYYPCPLFSVRFRDALYFEIGHTVMKVLADFRNFAYTLPGVRGLTIHLRNRMTDVMFPRNRYDQVIKGLNNSNDHVLAYASNFSIAADSHLVCIQTNTGDESTYQTQAISINNNPRTITGTSFIVINGALKSSMGLSAKSSIVEDGLMVEIMPEKMEALKAALKNMQDFSIGCGRQGAPEPDETVNIKWVGNDVQFNVGVKSPIDGQPMDGVPSIRVHNGIDYKGTSRFIRWTEVFIINSDDHPNGVYDPVDINKLSGNIAKATCTALVKLLDLLANAGLTKLAVRTTIHPDNVGYEAGSEGMKLPPIYMNSLDNELIQVLHKAAQNSQDTHTVLELIFYILDD
ncbi:zinc finger FYVE domain-containing protein 9 isoform X2 [Ceratina calcarata]|uniref:Zinc finger FYVE domain-containing protein 9 isoform X2 n=1 Tax=Ceratina calcarata TaxID=156304 RepID=A0AAJ7W8Z2_9HYME|nr:zinc finger FYVE domain-containing protein 9 isoform X2 [Ceratina calcarata]